MYTVHSVNFVVPLIFFYLPDVRYFVYALHKQNSELYQACGWNNVEEVQGLICKGADPTWKHPSRVRLHLFLSQCTCMYKVYMFGGHVQ